MQEDEAAIRPAGSRPNEKSDFVATSDRYTFEILGMSDSTGFKPQTAYRLDNVFFSILDISDSILEFTTGFDSLSEDIYSYFRESGDTIEMGAISYDTTATTC